MPRLLRKQLLRGGHIVLEQPRRSRLWRLLCVRRLVRLARDAGIELRFVDLDQCVYRLAHLVRSRRYKKATRFPVSSSRLSPLARK